ncbi:hypothetical protein CO229_01475 [Mycoplasmopsis bovirhinis]|uniref:MAG1140 family protein n=1 Tax=Mycoplasmopsis bovirhinis TaxID=29553 RepID=UPI000C05B34C|nr:hypothetical protein CO229_01475 [Mycoplasmopsis bovirhinis]
MKFYKKYWVSIFILFLIILCFCFLLYLIGYLKTYEYYNVQIHKLKDELYLQNIPYEKLIKDNFLFNINLNNTIQKFDLEINNKITDEGILIKSSELKGYLESNNIYTIQGYISIEKETINQIIISYLRNLLPI